MKNIFDSKQSKNFQLEGFLRIELEFPSSHYNSSWLDTLHIEESFEDVEIMKIEMVDY